MDDRYRTVYEYLNLRNESGQVIKIWLAGEGHGLEISRDLKQILFLKLDNDGKLKVHVAKEVTIIF